MKKNVLLFILPLLFLGACKKEKDVAVNDLPATSNTFISHHFSGLTITKVIKEIDNLKVTYDVYLSDGTKLEFDSDGTIRDMESKTALPEATLPATLVGYVAEHYQGQTIIEWEKSSSKQEIKLSNGIELEFDLNGNFLRVDTK